MTLFQAYRVVLFLVVPSSLVKQETQTTTVKGSVTLSITSSTHGFLPSDDGIYHLRCLVDMLILLWSPEISAIAKQFHPNRS